MLTTDDIPSIRARWLAEKRPGPRTLTGEEFGLVIDAVVVGLTEVERLRARVAHLEAGQDEAKGFIEGLDVQNNALSKRASEAEGRVALLETHLRSCALILDTVGYQDTAKALRSIAGDVPSAGAEHG